MATRSSACPHDVRARRAGLPASTPRQIGETPVRRRFWRAGRATAQPPQKLEVVQACPVAIPPGKTNRVVAHCRKVSQLQIAPNTIPDRSGVPLTSRAGAVASKYLVRILSVVTVGPFHVHCPRTVGSLDLHRLERRHHRGILVPPGSDARERASRT